MLKKTGAVNLSEGAPAGVIIRFSIPVIAGMLFQQIYSIVDAAIVGHFLGLKALAGVGSTTSLSFLFTGFCIGCCDGFAVPVAKCCGAEDHKGAGHFVISAFYLLLLFSALLTPVMTVFTGNMLQIMNTPEDISAYSATYLHIIFLGLPLIFFYNLVASVLRAAGDSRTPLIALLAASMINLLLDVLFIDCLHTGVSGAALATVLSQGISAVWCLIRIIRKIPWLLPQKDDLRPQPSLMKQLLSMGLPMGFQSSVMSVGTVFLQSAVNGLGTDAVAAATAGGKMAYLFAVFYEGLGTALASYTGQNIGAGKPERLGQGTKAAFVFGLCYYAFALLVMRVFGRTMICRFLNSTQEEIVSLAYRYTMLSVVFCPSVLALNVFRYMIQGAGYPVYSLLAGAVEVADRIAIALLIIPRSGFSGACMGNPSAWTLAALALLPIFIRIMKRQKKQRG